MKSQARSKRTWWVLAPMFLLALWLALFGDKTPVLTLTQPKAPALKQASVEVRVPPSLKQDAATTSQPSTVSTLIPLIPRSMLMPMDVRQAKSSRDLFTDRSWTPLASPAAPASAPAPMAPAVPFTYIGKRLEGSTWQVFLARADQTFVVSAGSTIDGLYRIDAVAPPTLSLTYLPLGHAQRMSIGEAK